MKLIILFSYEENTCNITNCPIIQNYGICTSIGNYGLVCVCPDQYEGDQCQYGINRSK